MFYKDLDKYGDNVALITENRNISYTELQNEIDKFKKILSGKAVAFNLCQNNEESVIGYIGFLQAGIVQILINPSIDRELYDNLYQTYQPKYIWGESKETENSLYTYQNYSLKITEYTEDVSVNHDLALLLTTSGSTGSPKLVRQSFSNISSNAASIAEYLNIKGEDRPITTLPMNYTYGLSIINSHLLKGAGIILTQYTLTQREFWKLLAEKEATTFGGVPYTYEILKRIHFLNKDYPSIKYLTQAGGKLGKELHYEFASKCNAKGINFIVMYGQTEATARMSYVPSDYSVEKAGSIGIAIPNGKLSLIDENGKEITETELVGELIYEGENVTLGYALCKEDLNKGDENNGRLFTGDMAMRDKDGYYYIVGRKKRFLKLFGNRVNLDEVEGLLKKENVECVCSGVDDCLKIYIMDQSKEDLVKKFILNRTAIPRQGFKIYVIDNIPRNDSGKILYNVLESLYE